MSEWIATTVGALGKVVTGKTPSKNNPEDWGNEYHFITPSDYGNYNKYANHSIRGLSEEGYKRHKVRMIPKNSCLVTCIGSDMGKVVLNAENAFCNQQINALIPNPSIIDNDYAYYFFKDLALTLKTLGSDGTAVPILNKSDFEKIELSIPPLPEQKAIASVLSSLDDKIDLLHRQNKTLEAMAETLFRQWFIEEAKEDWGEVKLGDLCDIITKGTTPKQFTESGVNFIKAESLTDTGSFILSKFASVSKETHDGFLKRSILRTGDLLFSIAGTIGRVGKVTADILPANTNQALAILRPKDDVNSDLIYSILKSAYFQELADGKVVHAVQPNLSLGEIANSCIRLPDQSVLQMFTEQASTYFDKKNANAKQIQTLEQLRDTLLSKLMSGEVRVNLSH